MNKFQWGIAALILCGLAVVILASNGFFDHKHDRRQVDLGQTDETPKRDIEHQPLSDALGTAEDKLVNIGGIQRPARDLNFDEAISRNPDLPDSIHPNPGRAPSLKGDENEEVAQLKRELQDERILAEAISTYKLPDDFDLASYQKNPKEYLQKIRPGRVYEPAQPGPDVKRLQPDVPYYHELVQGESLNIRLKADPGTPVTLHAQLGEFPNRLKTQTVRADENGIATATYKAGPGTIGPTEILAASPVHSGQLRFIVDVSLPETASQSSSN